jgi:triosephosphate isomerase
MNQVIIFANFKSFLHISEVTSVLQACQEIKKDFFVILAISFIHFDLVRNQLKWNHIAAQTCSPYDNDGEGPLVTASQIRDFGVEWVLVGHHERRLFEDNETLEGILIRAQENSLKVVFAFGENIEEKKAGFSEDVFQKQLEILKVWNDWECLFLAYQPVWAFQMRKGFKVEEALEVRTCVFDLLGKITCEENLEKVKFLVESSDFLKDVKKSGIDGVVVNENGEGIIGKTLELL